MNEVEPLDPRRIAAVVYDDGVAVDELLLVFARDLADKGVRVGGVIQMPRDPSCGPKAPMRVCDVATGEVFPICQTIGTPPQHCALDPLKLRQAAGRIRAASESAADLVFVSRFGKEEARGGGFRNELLHTVLGGHTVLTAVRRANVDNWLGLYDGIGTLLAARLWVLHRWWDDLGRTRRRAA